MSYPKYFYQFHRLLMKAQEDRGLLPMEFSGVDVNPYWSHWEMLTMMREVNYLRSKAGLPLVSWGDIVRVERMAAGHVDYTRKFALYCSEMAF